MIHESVMCLQCNNLKITQSPQRFECPLKNIDTDTLGELCKKSRKCKKFDAVLK